jgi:uncharacterized protein with HEPN domain
MSRDDAYLLDIVLAAREIRELANAIDQRAYEDSRVHQLAFMHDIEPLLAALEPIVLPDVP